MDERPKYKAKCIGRMLFDINHGNILFDPFPRIMTIKTKINQLNQLNSKTSAQQIKPLKKKPKRQPMEWEKIFTNDARDKGLISKYTNNSCNSTRTKNTTRLKNVQKT